MKSTAPLRLLTLISAWMVLSMGWLHAKDEWKVIKRDGTEVSAAKISADDQGNLKLQVSAGASASMTIRRGDYARVITPRPRQIDQLEDMLAKKDYDNAIAFADKLFDPLKYLGWADDIAYVKGMALLGKAQYVQANEAFELGMRYTYNAEEEGKLKRGAIQALLGMQKFDEAQKLVQTLSTKDPESAAFVYSLRGQLAAREGKKRDAVLQFLKIILLYPDAGSITQNAYVQVVALLKDMGDNRYMDFEKEMKEKYR